jgi:hypothetical protein
MIQLTPEQKDVFDFIIHNFKTVPIILLEGQAGV